jgi:hypothetical protein
MSEERARRAQPPRDHPIRAFSTLWSEAAARVNDFNRGVDGAGESGQDPSGFIESGVKNAYSVIDRYMSEGQRVASELGQTYADMGMGEGGQQMQARLMQLSGELVANWFDLVGLMTDSFLPTWGTDDAPDEPVSSSSAGVDTIFEIGSERPIRISADLTPGAQKFSLSGKPARHQQDADAGEIPFNVITSHQQNAITIQAQIDGAATPGVYVGNIVNDHTGEILGCLNIEIL